MNSFSDISLPNSLVKGLEKMSFKTPTPVQSAAIPMVLEGKDLLACAQTGTGKTAAFGIPMLAKMLVGTTKRVLIITPTRELACQIADVIDELAHFEPNLGISVLIGGASMNRQMSELRRTPPVVIGTPGRLVDHLERRSLDFSSFDMVILDEADRMFDMGFSVSMNEIFRNLPAKRQTLCFSATFSDEVVLLARKHMKSPERISIGSVEKPIEKISQLKIDVSGDEKNEKLLAEIEKRKGQMIVFVRTKHRTDRLTRFLLGAGIKAAAIHGGRSQPQRQAALNGFRTGRFSVLVATDVASRGLDIPDIQTVFNFDLPEVGEDYIHRIGRTARAGAEGEAVSFVTPEESRHWVYLSKGTGSPSPLPRKQPQGRGGRKPFEGRSKSGGKPRREGDSNRPYGFFRKAETKKPEEKKRSFRFFGFF